MAKKQSAARKKGIGQFKKIVFDRSRKKDIRIHELLPHPEFNINITEAVKNSFKNHVKTPLIVDLRDPIPSIPAIDNVNHPSHYTSGKIEVIDFIEDQALGFHLGNVVKYVSRAGKKTPGKYIEDLEKAAWYLNRKIQSLKKEQ